MRRIEVWADWTALGAPHRMGTLTAQQVRGKEIFGFEYAASWLASENSQLLDPELRLFPGPQYPSGRPNFGIFLDSAPDRWGRVLMRRREGILARREGRPARPLGELDFLMGVYDANRMGGLRFRDEEQPEFQNSDHSLAAPPWTSLRDLEFASALVDNDASDSELDPWLGLLLAPGSSLGGARPKASVTDADGSFWIAKFPGKSDTFDVGAWELVAHRLATAAGIETVPSRKETFSPRGTTFLTKSFDRGPDGRIHFSSAMTLLGYQDGADAAAGASYLELADLLVRHGAQTAADLAQLWRRIVFNIAISNTDDHLRNHGFLLTPDGWVLSPCYDINPSPLGQGLSLAINENDNSLDFDLALSVSPSFRLSSTQAQSILATILEAVSRWPRVATELGIARNEQSGMATAFRE